jgi:murein DD-endopeptidase MepM/ murein hydrolase activator NlpD
MKNNNWIYIWLISLVVLAGISIYNANNLDITTTDIFPLEAQTAGTEILESPTTQSLRHEQETALPGNGLEEDPITVVFPLSGDPPTSLWRPPLYPTPWAISPNDHFFFSRPIAADEINWPLANYRFGYFFPETDIIHTGIDITAKRGTPVIAAAPGTVIWTGYGLYYGEYNEDDPYGLAVTIKHDFGHNDKNLMTVYGHLDQIDVEEGQRVEAGAQIGIVGNTGNTTGPHLHFEVRVETNSYFRTRNPELWLSPPQGWGVLVGQLRDINYEYINLKEVYIRNKDTNQSWMVLTYATNNINRDEYYKENLVLSDLPAGEYLISFTYNGKLKSEEITIYPGAITFFTFHEYTGFSHNLPPQNPPDDWDDIVLTDKFLP